MQLLLIAAASDKGNPAFGRGVTERGVSRNSILNWAEAFINDLLEVNRK